VRAGLRELQASRKNHTRTCVRMRGRGDQASIRWETARPKSPSTDERVWVADQGDTTLSPIDPDHDNQVATYQLGFHPSAITVDDDRRGVWATVTA